MAKWFSAALNAAKLLQPKGSKEQMLNTLRKQPGVKQEEMDFLRLDELFNGQDVITAEQLQKAIQQRLDAAHLGVNPNADTYLPMANPANNIPGLRTLRLDAKNTQYPEYSLVHEDIPRPTTPQGMIVVDELDMSKPNGPRKPHVQHDYVERVPQAGTSSDAYDYDISGQHFPNSIHGNMHNPRVLNPRLNIGHTRGFTGDLVHPREVIALDQEGFPVEIPNRREPIFVLDELQSDLMQSIYSENRRYQKQLDNIKADQLDDKDNIIGQRSSDAEMDSTVKHINELAEQRKNLPFQKSWPELLLKDALQEAVDRDAPYFGWLNGERQAARYGPEQKREDGLKAFYDGRLVNSKLWKELGLEKPRQGTVSTKGDKFYDNGWENAWFVKLPPEVRKRIKEQGLPLFGLGALATYGPYENQGALYEQAR